MISQYLILKLALFYHFNLLRKVNCSLYCVAKYATRLTAKIYKKNLRLCGAI